MFGNILKSVSVTKSNIVMHSHTASALSLSCTLKLVLFHICESKKTFIFMYALTNVE